jgi:hypothetical protein
LGSCSPSRATKGRTSSADAARAQTMLPAWTGHVLSAASAWHSGTGVTDSASSSGVARALGATSGSRGLGSVDVSRAAGSAADLARDQRHRAHRAGAGLADGLAERDHRALVNRPRLGAAGRPSWPSPPQAHVGRIRGRWMHVDRLPRPGRAGRCLPGCQGTLVAGARHLAGPTRTTRPARLAARGPGRAYACRRLPHCRSSARSSTLPRGRKTFRSRTTVWPGSDAGAARPWRWTGIPPRGRSGSGCPRRAEGSDSRAPSRNGSSRTPPGTRRRLRLSQRRVLSSCEAGPQGIAARSSSASGRSCSLTHPRQLGVAPQEPAWPSSGLVPVPRCPWSVMDNRRAVPSISSARSCLPPAAALTAAIVLAAMRERAPICVSRPSIRRSRVSSPRVGATPSRSTQATGPVRRPAERPSER